MTPITPAPDRVPGALEKIRKFDPQFLVLSLGLDTAKGDPTGSFSLMARDFRENGRMIGALQLPTLVVQEGGYKTQTLGINARHFFNGLWDGLALKAATGKK
jgi:acetoin utilization deacetylase AcuC-like enzyme